MVSNWLKALDGSIIEKYVKFGKSRVGGNIKFYKSEVSSLKQNKIALIGVHPAAASVIRDHLYALEFPFAGLSIVDLGDLRKPTPAMVHPLVRELVSGGIIPVFMGGSDALAPAQFIGYQDLKALVNLTIVDERIRASDIPEAEEIWNCALFKRNSLLFHANWIGCQSHFLSGTQLEMLEKHHFELMRLGKAKAVPESCEPLIRDADGLIIHLSALKSADSPAVETPSPSGFTTEELCQLCRYGGISDKLTTFGIYGYANKADKTGQTAFTTAQMIWYFLEGVYNRKGDYPISTDGLTEYIVDYPGFNFQLTFWKSKKSGRWWMQTPGEHQKKHSRHYLIPCSFLDYQSACREELPDRLLRALDRLR